MLCKPQTMHRQLLVNRNTCSLIKWPQIIKNVSNLYTTCRIWGYHSNGAVFWDTTLNHPMKVNTNLLKKHSSQQVPVSLSCLLLVHMPSDRVNEGTDNFSFSSTHLSFLQADCSMCYLFYAGLVYGSLSDPKNGGDMFSKCPIYYLESHPRRQNPTVQNSCHYSP
jgi:hypothetical protein